MLGEESGVEGARSGGDGGVVECRLPVVVAGDWARQGRPKGTRDRQNRGQSSPTETARGSPGELNSNQGESRRSQTEIREKSSSREGEAAELPSHPRDAKHRLAADTTPRLPVAVARPDQRLLAFGTMHRRHPFISSDTERSSKFFPSSHKSSSSHRLLRPLRLYPLGH